MNRLDPDEGLAGNLNRAWRLTSSEGKAYFERHYGHWDTMEDSTKAQSMADFLYRRRAEAEEEQLLIMRRMMEEVMRPYQETLRGFAQALDARVGELNSRLGTIMESQTGMGKRLGDLETRSLPGDQRAFPSTSPPYAHSSMAGTPTGIQSQMVVYTGTTQKMDCRYREKSGPKECIVVETTPDGRYGTCTVGDQVRRMQILPRLFTTAFEKAGCPSNRLLRPCEYYLTETVKIS